MTIAPAAAITTRRTLLGAAPGLAAAALLTACATGTRIADMGGQIQPARAGMGRVWFYRSASPVGSAVQPTIYLNGQAVGRSMPNGAFYRDLPPGDYRVTTTTEVERQLTFTLSPGEERFVRTFVMPGFFVGHVGAELVEPAEGREDVATKAFTGQA